MTQRASDLWIFGYGSLMWRPDFPYLESHGGTIEGWSRRFWQGSTDHRGTPEAPGRVVTLVREPAATCWGAVFRVADAHRSAVLEQLDYRERGGFGRHRVEVRLTGNDTSRLEALMYVAEPGNPNFLGPAPLAELVDVVRSATGPSGSNREYVARLARALQEIGAKDPHIFALADALERLPD